MPDDFLNPYHFRPLSEGVASISDSGSLDIKDFRDEEFGFATATRDGHATYAPGTYSGRIVCKLTTKTPLVVGGRLHSGEKDKKAYNIIEPFLLEDRAAIPATSLKGMISSVLEAASNSAMRVLADTEVAVKIPIPGQRRSRKVSVGSVHELFRRAPGAIDAAESLPMSSERRRVTPAERMMGFVPVDADRSADPLPGLAGRLRFSNALLEGDHPFYDAPCQVRDSRFGNIPGGDIGFLPLRVLVDPKIKSTPMYYRPHGNAGETKESIAVGHSTPQGRKFYLHQTREIVSEPWRSRVQSAGKRQDMRSLAKPVRTDVVFWFHVDFDNLSRSELALLCFALRPTERFWHKLGHGKSIGLGSVQIDPVVHLEIERLDRYAFDNALDAPRATAYGRLADAPERYQRGAVASEKLKDVSPAKLAAEGLASRKDSVSVNALLRIGEGHDVNLPPVVPVAMEAKKLDQWISESEDAEDRTFEWFMNNDKAGSARQFLRPLDRARTLAHAALKPTPTGARRDKDKR